MFKPELLSPAGSQESVYAAVNNGADAVYLGGKQFGARQFADNFSNTELEEIIDYCHLRGVKVYVTVNTLYKEKELKPMMDFVKCLYEAGADAVIVQDIGAAMLIKEHYPKLSLHASTQLTANNIEDVKYLKSKGFDKVVLSRELSLEEIKEIKNNVDIELEVFIHGALCVSYSGQCIMSSMLAEEVETGEDVHRYAVCLLRFITDTRRFQQDIFYLPKILKHLRSYLSL